MPIEKITKPIRANHMYSIYMLKMTSVDFMSHKLWHYNFYSNLILFRELKLKIYFCSIGLKSCLTPDRLWFWDRRTVHVGRTRFTARRSLMEVSFWLVIINKDGHFLKAHGIGEFQRFLSKNLQFMHFLDKYSRTAYIWYEVNK